MTILRFIFLAGDAGAPGVGVDQFANLGMAGLMGAMWLWERRTSRQREQQLDEAHARILGDQLQLDQLLDVVRKNTEAITKLSTAQDQLIARLTAPPAMARVGISEGKPI